MRILVDMSATLLHHGHIRLLKKAKMHGDVIIALTYDDEIRKVKGYEPELSFECRKEILESIKYVDEVIGSPWLITQEFLLLHNIDKLVHGDDNSNDLKPEQILIYPRTIGISSTELRKRAAIIYDSIV